MAGATRSDTIYEVDRIGEAAVLAWFERRWPRSWPVELVMEGLEEEPTTFPRGTPVGRTAWRCIVDPIDGTRSLMYDKRPAWALAGLAPQRGRRTHLGDIVVAAMTELPTAKQAFADQVSAIRGRGRRGLSASRVDLRAGTRSPLALRPSAAADFHHGFASFVRFFPEGKALTARIEEEVWRALGVRSDTFEEQYLSTGGQLYELLSGRDRLVADLRPLVYAKLGLASALTCHPYDICTALVLTEAGGVVEAPRGGPLRVPLDTVSPVAWVGYASGRLARLVRPALRRALRDYN